AVPQHMSCTTVKVGKGLTLRMAVVDERLPRNVFAGKQFGTLAYDLVQGALVRRSGDFGGWGREGVGGLWAVGREGVILWDGGGVFDPVYGGWEKVAQSGNDYVNGYGDGKRQFLKILKFEKIIEAGVKWSSLMDKSVPEPPTAVLIHGILGCRKNWSMFHISAVHLFAGWLKVFQCGRLPHTVATAARDVLNLVDRKSAIAFGVEIERDGNNPHVVAQLRIVPRVLVGHSFGGKVVLSMVEQAAKPLARPVRVWVLDATPGKVRTGGHGEDHPAKLISFLRTMPEQVC
ncbi:Protein ABHD11, partial [Bienertia sinuspersici]